MIFNFLKSQYKNTDLIDEFIDGFRTEIYNDKKYKISWEKINWRKILNSRNEKFNKKSNIKTIKSLLMLFFLIIMLIFILFQKPSLILLLLTIGTMLIPLLLLLFPESTKFKNICKFPLIITIGCNILFPICCIYINIFNYFRMINENNVVAIMFILLCFIVLTPIFLAIKYAILSYINKFNYFLKIEKKLKFLNKLLIKNKNGKYGMIIILFLNTCVFYFSMIPNSFKIIENNDKEIIIKLESDNKHVELRNLNISIFSERGEIEGKILKNNEIELNLKSKNTYEKSLSLKNRKIVMFEKNNKIFGEIIELKDTPIMLYDEHLKLEGLVVKGSIIKDDTGYMFPKNNNILGIEKKISILNSYYILLLLTYPIIFINLIRNRYYQLFKKIKKKKYENVIKKL